MWRLFLDRAARRGKRRPLRLGRWTASDSDKRVARKAELAAADNCGVSGVPRRPRSAPDSAFDSSMDASLCALQSLHAYARAPSPKR